MFGLRQQVGGDEGGRRGLVGNDDDFRRPGDRINADRAVDQLLRDCDIDVARPDDLIDARHALGAEGERRDRLRAADAVDFRDAEFVNDGGDCRNFFERAGRRRNRDARHAGDLRRHGVHQHG